MIHPIKKVISMKKSVITAVSIMALGLTACGSDSDDNAKPDVDSINPSEAQITAATSRDLALASTYANNQAFAAQNLPQQRYRSATTGQSLLESNTQTLITRREKVDGICDSGYIDVNSDDVGNSTINYSNCVISSGAYTITTHGVVEVTSSEDGDRFSAHYKNFTVSSMGESHSFDNFSIECSGLNTDSISCSSSTSFSEDGVAYRLEAFTLDGNNAGGKIFHQSHGYVTFASSNISYGCDNAMPQTGSIDFYGSEGSTGSITFNDCSSYTVMFNDTGEIYEWQ